MTTSAHTPTAEQQHIRELFGTKQSLAIEAGAGTGKTSTLLMIAADTIRRGQYVAFNRSIVEEGKKKFPEHVAANTAHSLAMRAVGFKYAERLRSSARMKSWDLATKLGIDPIVVTTFDGSQKKMHASYLAGLTMRSIERFCTTADPEPSWRHVPSIQGLDDPAAKWADRHVSHTVARHIEPSMRRAWKDLLDVNGSLPYKHSHYLKAWQLDDPRIEADFILFDEAQDASPVMVDIVANQKHAQLVWVGDSQQQIYGFTGAINALANVPSDQRAFLTQSFRFGPAIADAANLCLAGLNAELRLVGFDPIESRVERLDAPRAVLARTNAKAFRTVLASLNRGEKPHLVGGGSEIASFTRAAMKLMDGGRTEHYELACFETWGEVQDYVQQDEQGGDLKLMVDLIDEFGPDKILEAVDVRVPEARADVIVSTAHKAKGREWSTVRVANDFPDQPFEEELRLLYVAATRAQHVLDVTGSPYFDKLSAVTR